MRDIAPRRVLAYSGGVRALSVETAVGPRQPNRSRRFSKFPKQTRIERDLDEVALAFGFTPETLPYA